MFKRFLYEEDGMEMIEWVLVAVLFAVVASVAYGTVAGGVTTALTNVTNTLAGA